MIGSAKINLGSLFFCIRFYFHILPSRKFTTVIKSDGFENIFKAITVKLVKLVDLHIYFFRRFGRNRDHIVKSSFSFQQSKISTILTISRTSNQIALPMTKRFSGIDRFRPFSNRNPFLSFRNICLPVLLCFSSDHARKIDRFNRGFTLMNIVIKGFSGNSFHIINFIPLMNNQIIDGFINRGKLVRFDFVFNKRNKISSFIKFRIVRNLMILGSFLKSSQGR